MSEIELKNITKNFDNVKAVDNISLKVEEERFVTLLGPSGCGKTTTLRMIAGLEAPTEGQIFMGEKNVTSVPPYERNIGMVFQNLALFPHLNIFDNIAYGMKVGKRKYQKDEIRDKVKEMLDLVELPGMGNRYPSQLSGGQQQRIALSRALSFDPLVLLLDEPLANLDRKLRERMQVELRRIQKKVGITTVFVTHDQEEAMTMSDLIAIMRKGRLIQIGSPTKVYEAPNSIFVADFIGTMNFFNCLVEGLNEDVIALRSDDFDLRVPKTGKQINKEQEIILSIRPEAIQFSDRAKSTLSGRIDLKRYLGNTIEYHIYSNHGKEIIVTQPKSADRELKEGETAHLFLSAEDCFLFKT